VGRSASLRRPTTQTLCVKEKAMTDSKKSDAVSQDESEKKGRDFDDFSEFVNEFKKESDRAAVILGASKLDQLLGMILTKHLIPCPTSTDDLFDNNGPLGTFSSKINMCFRLGLIDSELCRAIHLTRRIRNSFAHEVYGAKLDSGSHKDRIKSLVANIKNNKHFIWLKEHFFKDVNKSRADFSTALGVLIVRLEGVLEHVETISGEDAYHILPND
jgi:DNA-binding MltR family transcriptional regulator